MPREQHMSEDVSHKSPCMSGRRKRVVLVLLTLVAIVSVGVTAAFTTRSFTSNNVIIFGNVRMRTIETERASDGTEEPVRDGSTVRAESGRASRVVKFQNVGGADMFVRARPVVTALSAQGSEAPAPTDIYRLAMNEGGAPDQWTCGPDGWWYYNSPVRAARGGDGGQTTGALMSGIEFMGDFYRAVEPGGAFVLTVDAQAVQTSHNTTRALDAAGWPEE